MASARVFFQWFWKEVNNRSTEQINELNAKAMEVKLWWDENNLQPDWLWKVTACRPRAGAGDVNVRSAGLSDTSTARRVSASL